MNKKLQSTKIQKRLRRYSPKEQQLIKDLANLLSELVPATSQGDFCLSKLAKKAGLGKYFNTKLSNKRKQFNYFIQQVYGRHPRMFKALINNMLADSVEWRRSKGNPMLRAEAEQLKNTLSLLNTDLKKEIDELNLPTDRPKITPPPIHIKQILEKFGLHPSLLKVVLPLFNDGYINEAVRKSGEIYEATIMKQYPGLNKYGRDLISTVFNTSNGLHSVSGYHNSEVLNPSDEKEGYLFLSMGAIHWCKNIMSHGDVEQLSPADAAARIMLISHLLEVFDSTSNTNTSQNSEGSNEQ